MPATSVVTSRNVSSGLHGRADALVRAAEGEHEARRRAIERRERLAREGRAAQTPVFSEILDVTGIVLTKLDGSANGGILVAVQRDLGVPVKLVGLGEGPDDLARVDPDAFVDALRG